MSDRVRPDRVRIDRLLVDRGLCDSRTRAQALVIAGKVVVGEQRVDKPGTLVPVDADVRVRGDDNPYVSRGGLKLAGALARFCSADDDGGPPLSISGRVAMDVGASTGGFTDCLLQRGALKVWAVDVGSNQLDYRLRADPRVESREGVNAREPGIVDLVGEPVDLIVSDVSFISLTLAIPPSLPLLKPGGKTVLLIKPQFEAGREAIGKGGLVSDPAVRREVVERVVAFFRERGLRPEGVVPSPVTGGKSGNVEYLAFFIKGEDEETAKKSLDTGPLTP